MKLKLIIVFIVLLLGINIHSVSADDKEPSDALRIGPYIGFSMFTGMIGAEIQKGHMGVSLGLPGNLGVKYYFDKNGVRWFAGAYAMYTSYDEKETIDNIEYKDYKSKDGGLGLGYKWRWRNHWDLSLNCSIGYRVVEQTGDFAVREEESIVIIPGIIMGYMF